MNNSQGQLLTVESPTAHKILLRDGVVMAFRNMVHYPCRKGNHVQAPGCDLYLPCRPGEHAVVRVERGWAPQRICYPSPFYEQALASNARPPWVPGAQVVRTPLPQEGCVASPEAPVESRCWARLMGYDDLVVFAADLVGDKPVPAGYALQFAQSVATCGDILSADCMRTYGVLGCYRTWLDAHPGEGSDALRPRPAGAPTTWRPPPDPAASLLPRSGGGGGNDNRDVLIGVLVGVLGGAALLGAVAAVLLVRRRRQGLPLPCSRGASRADDKAGSVVVTLGGGGTGGGGTGGGGAAAAGGKDRSAGAEGRRASCSRSDSSQPGEQRPALVGDPAPHSANGAPAASAALIPRPYLSASLGSATSSTPASASASAQHTTSTSHLVSSGGVTSGAAAGAAVSGSGGGGARYLHSSSSRGRLHTGADEVVCEASEVHPEVALHDCPLAPDVVRLLPGGALGRGAHGRVVLGEYKGQRVAVKILEGAWAEQPLPEAAATAAPVPAGAAAAVVAPVGAAAAVVAPAAAAGATPGAPAAAPPEAAAPVAAAPCAAALELPCPAGAGAQGAQAAVCGELAGAGSQGGAGGREGQPVCAAAPSDPTALHSLCDESLLATYLSAESAEGGAEGGLLGGEGRPVGAAAAGEGPALPQLLQAGAQGEEGCAKQQQGEEGCAKQQQGEEQLPAGGLCVKDLSMGPQAGAPAGAAQAEQAGCGGAAAPAGGRSAAEAEAGAAQDPHTRALLQEVEVLARCQHPNVVRLLAACLAPPQPCLVMELMETSLDCMLHGAPGRRLPMDKVLHIAIDVARALEYLHPTIIHRDLKPANVLVNNPDGERPVAKLSDFGLSRLRNTAVVTMNPEVGTPAFIAPECFNPQNYCVTHHADMYSFGMMLWVMLSGQAPWPNLNPVTIAYSVAMLHRRPAWSAVDPSRAPSKLVKLVNACWEADPKRRPAAAEAVKQLLLQQEQQQQLWMSTPVSKSASDAAAAAAASTAAATATAAQAADGKKQKLARRLLGMR